MILGRLCIIGMLSDVSSVGVFMLECCRICGEVIVLVYSSILWCVWVLIGVVLLLVR